MTHMVSSIFFVVSSPLADPVFGAVEMVEQGHLAIQAAALPSGQKVEPDAVLPAQARHQRGRTAVHLVCLGAVRGARNTAGRRRRRKPHPGNVVARKVGRGPATTAE